MNELIMPQAVEVERHVIGAMLLDAEAVSAACGILEGADFYDPRYSMIFDAVVGLFQQNQNIDLLTVSEAMKAKGSYDRAGGDLTLLEISGEVVTSSSILAHAKIVKDKSLKRKQIRLASWLNGAAFGDRPGAEIQDELEKQSFALHEQNRSTAVLRPIRDVLIESFAAIAKLQAGGLTGLPTGLKSVDAHMGGMQPGDLIVLSGRPGQGKTSIGAQIGISVAERGNQVAFFECEMKDRAIVDRALFAKANISHQLFKHGKIEESRFKDLKTASDALKDIPFFINDAAGITPMQVRSQSRRLQREGGLSLIVIDNIQRMKSDSATSDVRVRTGEVSAALKEIAKEFNVPVIAISHLRRLTNGEGTEPTLADLQESGNIEQDADIVLSLFNLSLYKEVPDGEEGRVKLSFLKYREGSLGYVDLYFEKTLTTFKDWDDRPIKKFSAEGFTSGTAQRYGKD